MLRIPFDEMLRTFEEILQRHGFAPDRGATCAQIFAENSLDGVYSHGVNRLPALSTSCAEDTSTLMPNPPCCAHWAPGSSGTDS